MRPETREKILRDRQDPDKYEEVAVVELSLRSVSGAFDFVLIPCDGDTYVIPERLSDGDDIVIEQPRERISARLGTGPGTHVRVRHDYLVRDKTTKEAA